MEGREANDEEENRTDEGIKTVGQSRKLSEGKGEGRERKEEGGRERKKETGGKEEGRTKRSRSVTFIADLC